MDVCASNGQSPILLLYNRSTASSYDNLLLNTCQYIAFLIKIIIHWHQLLLPFGQSVLGLHFVVSDMLYIVRTLHC